MFIAKAEIHAHKKVNYLEKGKMKLMARLVFSAKRSIILEFSRILHRCLLMYKTPKSLVRLSDIVFRKKVLTNFKAEKDRSQLAVETGIVKAIFMHLSKLGKASVDSIGINLCTSSSITDDFFTTVVATINSLLSKVLSILITLNKGSIASILKELDLKVLQLLTVNLVHRM